MTWHFFTAKIVSFEIHLYKCDLRLVIKMIYIPLSGGLLQSKISFIYQNNEDTFLRNVSANVSG